MAPEERAPGRPHPRAVLAARVVGALVAVAYSLAVFGEFWEGRMRIDFTTTGHGAQDVDHTLWLAEGLGPLVWALFKIPPLAALWLALLRWRWITRKGVWLTLLVLHVLGLAGVALLEIRGG